ncbi:MAG: hypothetical protein HY883_04750 [Deltaproteobacteria bacterium]|nr:hypothetical protein [Deltaproteobacteria bacterium]
MSQVDELKTENKGGVSTAESSKVTFTPEQQAKVQELIDESYRKAYEKAARRPAMGEELDGLKREVESLKEEKKMAYILRAVARHNVVDPEDVAESISRHVKVDEGGSVVVNGDGRSKGGVHPLTIAEYVEEWLGERPHHLRSTGAQGGGSGSSRFGDRTRARHNLADPDIWRSMPREDLGKLLREGVNVHGTSGQVFKFKDVQNPFVEARKRKFQAG